MIKRIVALVAIMSVVMVVSGQTRQTRAEYVNRYKDFAIANMERYGIPASITMAQGILESDSGNGDLTKRSNNHFGIKCKTGWSGRSVSHDDDAPQECFRAYDDAGDSFRDHAEFLDSGQRYDALFSYSHTDYKSWANGLKAAGYATAPHYANMLIKIIEDEKLFLLDYEGGAAMFQERDGYTVQTFDGTPASILPLEQRRPVETLGGNAEKVVDPDNYRVSIGRQEGYMVYRTNDLYYIEAKAGDSMAKIARKFELWKGNLRRFNDFEVGHTLTKGEIVYVESKRSAWRGVNDTHTVASGETIVSLSQLYGVKQRALRKLNKLSSSTNALEEGTKIKLR